MFLYLCSFWALGIVLIEDFIAGPMERLNMVLVIDKTGANSLNLKVKR